MKNKLQFILGCICVLAVIFSGCQKQDQLVPPTPASANDNNINKSEQNDKVLATLSMPHSLNGQLTSLTWWVLLEVMSALALMRGRFLISALWRYYKYRGPLSL